MPEAQVLAYLHRHYVAWLLQGQWDPELSLPEGTYPTDGEWMLVTWRCASPLKRAGWSAAEALVEQRFAGVCDVWPLCRGEQVSALAMAKTLSTPAMQAMVWVAATAVAEELSGAGDSPAQVCLGDVCQSYTALPTATLSELNVWWTVRSRLSPQERREHRKRIQNYLKKGQYGHISGYAARCLQRDGQRDGAYWYWIPLVMESFWMQTSTPMSLLTAYLDNAAILRDGADAMVAWLHKTCAELKRTSVPDDPIRRVMDSISRDCSLPYSQTNLAEGLGLTPAYFSRLFERRAGVRFTDYLTRARIERAQQCLRGGASLGEVAQASGFQRKSYFCEVFKKQTGMTALHYRAMHRKGDGQ
jgi:AraC-like DNA-binding protein